MKNEMIEMRQPFSIIGIDPSVLTDYWLIIIVDSLATNWLTNSNWEWLTKLYTCFFFRDACCETLPRDDLLRRTHKAKGSKGNVSIMLLLYISLLYAGFIIIVDRWMGALLWCDELVALRTYLKSTGMSSPSSCLIFACTRRASATIVYPPVRSQYDPTQRTRSQLRAARQR